MDATTINFGCKCLVDWYDCCRYLSMLNMCIGGGVVVEFVLLDDILSMIFESGSVGSFVIIKIYIMNMMIIDTIARYFIIFAIDAAIQRTTL